jgi:hypothetical protein
MKKVILCGMLLSLLTGMCFAQRGGARSMGTVGPNVRMAPNAGMAPDARPLPNARNVGSNIGTAGSNVGSGTHAKAVGPASVAGANATKAVDPDSVAGPKARTVVPDATTALDAGPSPQ